jgi:hypothetical protein
VDAGFLEHTNNCSNDVMKFDFPQNQAKLNMYFDPSRLFAYEFNMEIQNPAFADFELRPIFEYPKSDWNILYYLLQNPNY